MFGVIEYIYEYLLELVECKFARNGWTNWKTFLTNIFENIIWHLFAGESHQVVKITVPYCRQITVVTTWLPRVYLKYVCKQLLEINYASTWYTQWPQTFFTSFLAYEYSKFAEFYADFKSVEIIGKKSTQKKLFAKHFCQLVV